MKKLVFIFVLLNFCFSTPSLSQSKGSEALIQKAEQGDAKSQCELGINYHFGWGGLPQDDKSAVNYFRKAADQGYGDAQYWLGFCYSGGYGVQKDETQAFNWYKKSADNGNDRGQLRLGEAYFRGEGVACDRSKAIIWYQKSAEQGNKEAQYNLGHFYEEGLGVTKDNKKADYWYQEVLKKEGFWANVLKREGATIIDFKIPEITNEVYTNTKLSKKSDFSFKVKNKIIKPSPNCQLIFRCDMTKEDWLKLYLIEKDKNTQKEDVLYSYIIDAKDGFVLDETFFDDGISVSNHKGYDFNMLMSDDGENFVIELSEDDISLSFDYADFMLQNPKNDYKTNCETNQGFADKYRLFLNNVRNVIPKVVELEKDDEMLLLKSEFKNENNSYSVVAIHKNDNITRLIFGFNNTFSTEWCENNKLTEGIHKCTFYYSNFGEECPQTFENCTIKLSEDKKRILIAIYEDNLYRMATTLGEDFYAVGINDKRIEIPISSGPTVKKMARFLLDVKENKYKF